MAERDRVAEGTKNDRWRSGQCVWVRQRQERYRPTGHWQGETTKTVTSTHQGSVVCTNPLALSSSHVSFMHALSSFGVSMPLPWRVWDASVNSDDTQSCWRQERRFPCNTMFSPMKRTFAQQHRHDHSPTEKLGYMLRLDFFVLGKFRIGKEGFRHARQHGTVGCFLKLVPQETNSPSETYIQSDTNKWGRLTAARSGAATLYLWKSP